MDKSVILIVDDNKEILDFLSDDLSEYFHVRTAKNGVQALEIVEKETIQLIVSDVMMPEMDGFELCNIIKSDHRTSHIAVVLLTAKNTLQSKIEGLELGADAYIEKPFSPKHLQAQINSLLANKIKLKAYFANSPLTHMKSLAYTKTDELFLEELNNIIAQHLSDSSLDVDHLAKYINMSRPTLYRKIKEVTDLSPKELINLARLKKAASLFAEENYRINEIAELVGYTSPLHFSRNFLKQFGVTPQEFLKSSKGGSAEKLKE